MRSARGTCHRSGSFAYAIPTALLLYGVYLVESLDSWPTFHWTSRFIRDPRHHRLTSWQDIVGEGDDDVGITSAMATVRDVLRGLDPR